MMGLHIREPELFDPPPYWGRVFPWFLSSMKANTNNGEILCCFFFRQRRCARLCYINIAVRNRGKPSWHQTCYYAINRWMPGPSRFPRPIKEKGRLRFPWYWIVSRLVNHKEITHPKEIQTKRHGSSRFPIWVLEYRILRWSCAIFAISTWLSWGCVCAIASCVCAFPCIAGIRRYRMLC